MERFQGADLGFILPQTLALFVGVALLRAGAVRAPLASAWALRCLWLARALVAIGPLAVSSVGLPRRAIALLVLAFFSLAIALVGTGLHSRSSGVQGRWS